MKFKSPLNRGGGGGGGHSNYFFDGGVPHETLKKSWLQAQNIGSLELKNPEMGV